MIDTTQQPRSYGGWRRSRSIGLGSMDTRQTVMVTSAIFIPIAVVFFVGRNAGLIAAVPGAFVAVLAMLQRNGVLVMDMLTARLRWQLADLRNETLYQAQVFAELPEVLDLPGVLAPTKLLAVEEPGRATDPVGVVWNQRTGLMSVTLLLSPAGALLADHETVQRQVAHWGQLLAGLANDPAIVHMTVTIELLPESGTQLADHVVDRMDSQAPDLARRVLGQVVASAPHGSAQVHARLTVTVDPRRGANKPRSVAEAAAETIRVLGGLPVAAAGADVLRRATPGDLIRIVRLAYDPDASASRAEDWEDLTWADAAPSGTAYDWLGHYRHGKSFSINWALLEAPRQQVPHDVLLRLLSPGRYPRRITLAYRTLSRDEAGALLEREANAAAAREEYRRRTKRDPTQREKADAERAITAARQEARGAGLVQFSLYVTATVTDLDDLAQARREVEQAAGSSLLKLRVANGGQAACFATGMPCGINPIVA